MSSVIKHEDLITIGMQQKIDTLEKEILALKQAIPEDKVSIIVLSGDFDKAMAAFMMANGAVAMGMEVSMFFTFWGCSVIKKDRKLKGKKFTHKLVNMMLPANAEALSPSKMAFAGLGRKFFNHMMRGQLSSLEEQIEIAVESGVHFQVCAPSLGLMGFDADEWRVPVDVCGVAAMYDVALNARTAYFIS
ncbi:MAG: DsrE/DsrF/DrsH-like family protein [Sedimenticola sp.]